MKQKDVSLIVVIAVVSAFVSLFLSSKVFVTPDNRQQQVPTIDTISSSFDIPGDKYFNEQSINPAQEVQIKNSNNTNPFKPVRVDE